jgi:hypothetical protein
LAVLKKKRVERTRAVPPTSGVSSDMVPARENDSVRPPAVPRPFCTASENACSCSMRRFCSGAEEEQEEDEEQEE